MKLCHLIFATSQLMLITMASAAEYRNTPLKSTSLADVSVVRESQEVAYPHSRVIGQLPSGGGATFFENFDSMAIPAGWVLVNVDGLVPSLVFVNDAWVAGDDIAAGVNFAAISTSWYTPVGQADDWLITPAISLLDLARLSWRARARDATFPDGYEVYVSTTTQDVAGCSANPAVFAIAAEESADYVNREVDLAAAGFLNQNVHICYRNNSNNQFILEIDDILVGEGFINDLAINATGALPEYTIYPTEAGTPSIPLSLEIINNGIQPQSNFSAEFDILKNGIFVTTLSATEAGPLAATQTIQVSISPYLPDGPGVYSVNYVVRLESGTTDANPTDNNLMVDNVQTVTLGLMARDDGIITGALGIGAGNGGQLGQQFVIENEATIVQAFFSYNNTDCDMTGCGLDGKDLTVSLLDFDTMAGTPGNVIASTDPHVVPAGMANATTVTADFPGPILLQPGTYVLVINEPLQDMGATLSSSVGISYASNRFTPGTTWVNWPTSPTMDWANNESFGFEIAYILRAIFQVPLEIFSDSFETP